MSKARVLFLCTGNSARSQMAEGFLRDIAGDRFEVFSAGTHPTRVNPLAIEVMSEVGVDISNHQSKNVGDFLKERITCVVTVCDQANERCPIFPFAFRKEHWSFEDPAAAQGTAEERKAVFRRVRDGIKERVQKFAEKA